MVTKKGTPNFQEKILADLFYYFSFSIPIDEAILKVLEFISRSFQADAGYIYLYNEIKDSLQLASLTPSLPRLPDVELKAGEGIEGWVARERAPLYVQHTPSDPRYIPVPGHLPVAGVIAIPMETNNQLAGVLTLGSNYKFELFPDDIHVLSFIGSKLAEFVFAARWHKHLEDQVHELSFLMRIINLADAAGKNTEKFLRAIENELPRFFQLSKARIYLANDLDPNSYCTFLQEGKGLVKNCPAIGKKIPLIVNDTDAAITCKAVRECKSSSLICIPLCADKNALGILQMEGKIKGAFPEEKVEFFMAIGNQIASSLEKAHVRENLEERVRELSGVYEAVSFELSALSGNTQDQEEFLKEATKLIKRLVNVDKVSIYLLERENDGLILSHTSPKRSKHIERFGEDLAGWVAKVGRPLSGADLPSIPGASSQSIHTAGMKGLLCVPMMIGNRRRGVITVGTIEPREFTQADVKLLSLVASRLAIALENVELQSAEISRRTEILAKHQTLKKQSKDLEKANQNLIVLYELHQTLGSTLELLPLLEKIIEQIALVLEAPISAITIHLVDLEQKKLDLVAQKGVPQGLLPKYQLRFDDLPHEKFSLLLNEQKPIILHDVTEDQELRTLVRGRIRSFYALPLIAKDRMQGILTLSSPRKNAITQEKLELMQAISNQLAVAMENARLYQTSKRFGKLNQFVATVRSFLDLGERLHQIVENSASLLGQEFALIALVEEGGLFRIRASVGLPHELESEEILHFDPELEKIFLNGEPVILSECRSEAYYPIPLELKERNGSLLLVPLKVKDRVIGLLLLGNFHPIQYSREEIEFATLVANQMGVAVENSLLYHHALMERNTLEALVRGMGDGVVTIALDGRITSCNEAAERLSGLKKERVIGRLVKEVFRVEKEDPSIYLPDYSKSFDTRAGIEQTGIQQEGIIYYKKNDNDFTLSDQCKRDISAIHTLLINEKKEPAGWVMVFRDITKEKQLSQAKSDFVAMASHDLRTPLTAIKGYAVTLLRHDKQFPQETQKEFLKVINSEIDRLSRLLDNLLNLSRIEAGRLEVRKDYVDLYDISKKTVDLFKLSATKHEFVLFITQDFPKVYADQGQLDQILNNLVSNAIKYSPAGGTITIGGEIKGDEWVGSVSDEGMGIPKEQISKLFERFHRIDSKLTRHVSGTGLGLFITKSLIEAQGGRIWVESEQGKGTTFYFALPNTSDNKM